MVTEIEIVRTDNLAVRSYIKFYHNNIRYREYNGNRIGKSIHPNREKTIQARDKALRTLRLEIQTALENNCFFKPLRKKESKPNAPATISAKKYLSIALQKKLDSNITQKYKRSLQTTHNQFIAFLKDKELSGPITDITASRVEEFLLNYNVSNTYYMSKRRELGVFFTVIGRYLNMQLMTVKSTERKRIKAKLHTIYEKDRLREILAYLKINHHNLYLCCLLTYGTFLRPHKEIRLLTKGHFKKDFTEIHLSGEENKSGKVRVVYVSDFIRTELIPLLSEIDQDTNLFSRRRYPHNNYYFGTAWTRTWDESTDLKVKQYETIYSFRHTAAVDVYRRTKDLHVLQQLMGHSDMIVTLNYLRGLGELNLAEQKQYMPTL